MVAEQSVQHSPCWLSVIVPALNESRSITALLAILQPWRAQGAEVIVVDGGSTDNTVALAAPLADQVLLTRAGRATQMNAGAAAANGQLLWFVHADTTLSGAEIRLLQSCMAKLQCGGWGRFDVRLSGADWRLRMVAGLMNLRSRVTGIATGDQALFVSRDTFVSVGGFPLQPLMEDVEISARLRRLSWPICLGETIVTDSRRWQRHGVWRTIALMWSLRWRYFCGESPVKLHRDYYGGSSAND